MYKRQLYTLLPFLGFALAYSIPRFTRRFLEASVYDNVFISYIRYNGFPSLFFIGGLMYIITKKKKNEVEWFILLSLIGITTFIYVDTYMKWFSIIPVSIFSGVGLLAASKNLGKKSKNVFPYILITFVVFSGYYNTIHHYFDDTNQRTVNERFIEESTLVTGKWLGEYINGTGITNDQLFGVRLLSSSENISIVTGYSMVDYTYSILIVNFSQFKMHPITSDQFWYGSYQSSIDFGESRWYTLNNEWDLYSKDINYYVENKYCGKYVCWHHSAHNAKVLNNLYASGDLVYDSIKTRVWK